jgi:hypothetical protein
MGNGYFSDGGSTDGVSWKYKDFNNSDMWYNTYTSSARPPIDFITNPTTATSSFAYGGGTWYTSSASQTFNYQTSDIDMDVTNIVMSWISGSIPNNGFILISSDELQSTGSGFTLKFFSRDTNTIYYPYLDVMWLGNGVTSGGDDYVTGSFSTGSVTISSVDAGINVTVQSGSTFSIAGGIDGVFSGSTFLTKNIHYTTSSNVTINASLEKFSGSFSGSFVTNLLTYINGLISGSADILLAEYFSGSLDGGPIAEANNTTISASFVYGVVTGSVVVTASVSYFEGNMIGVTAVYGYPITINATGLYGTYYDSTLLNVGGIVVGKGLTGNIVGLPVVGAYAGTITPNLYLVTGPCGSTFSASFITASFMNGVFSGSTFTAYYTDKIENAHLTGSWSPNALLGSNVNIPIPSGIEPYAYAYVTGIYVNGKALGLYTLSGSNSASFVGQFIEGPLLGGYINYQLSGNIYTSSYSYTSSVSYTSSSLEALNVSNPYTIIIQNVHPTYKSGDIIKFGIFGRKQFPLKTFGISTQQTQYLVPEYLPTSSYYALKDNETGEIVMGFDNYTTLGCEYPAGNYFVIDTTSLPQERLYKVLIRVEDNGTITTTDCGKTFRITR